jgi:type III restriction enzyme
LTIKDRLRVLQPNDPESYYASRELVPNDMLDEVNRAKIVITNFHAFKLRERLELSKGGRQLLQGRVGEELNTQETEGQMLQRVMPDLMGMKNILVIDDEAHHCYREKPKEDDDEDLKGEDKKEAEKNNEAARLWISGLEAVNRKLGISRVMDLSATPFFLRGSGYAEGTLAPSPRAQRLACRKRERAWERVGVRGFFSRHYRADRSPPHHYRAHRGRAHGGGEGSAVARKSTPLTRRRASSHGI